MDILGSIGNFLGTILQDFASSWIFGKTPPKNPRICKILQDRAKKANKSQDSYEEFQEKPRKGKKCKRSQDSHLEPQSSSNLNKSQSKLLLPHSKNHLGI